MSFLLVITPAAAQAPWTTPPTQLEAVARDPGIGQSILDQQNGEFQHRIGIKAPVYHGIEPNLALQYHSLAGNGFAGVGWSLAGMAVIQRASPGKGTPVYDNTDVFVLDGVDLVPCSSQTSSVSPSCNSGGNYSTKIENYKRIYYDSGADTWTITQKDGTKFTYVSVYLAASKTFRWGLSSATDTRTNTVNYSWWCDVSGSQTLDCYPDTVSYNGTNITFHRELRPDVASFANGAYLGQTRYRLKTIDVTVNNGRARAYALAYSQPGASTGRSLLQSVQMYGKDATLDPTTHAVTGGTALPPETMQWTARAPALAATPWISGNSAIFVDSWVAGDFDGDGKTDILMRGLDTSQNAASGYLYLNASGSLLPTQLWSSRTCQLESGAQAALYQGYCGVDTDAMITGDFNGDGKTDFIVHRAQQGAIFFANHTGAFNTPAFMYAQGQPYCGTNGVCYPTMGDPWVVGDFNGDGKTDFIVHNTRSAMLFTANAAGTGFDGTWLSNNTSSYQGWVFGAADQWTTGDFNGDGKTDFIISNATYGALFTANASGAGFTVHWLWANSQCYQGFCPAQYSGYRGPGLAGGVANGWVTGDFNGDGKTDFIIPGNKYGAMFLSTGTGFQMAWLYQNSTCFQGFCDPTGASLPNQTTSYSNRSWFAGDFNGDGKTDVLIAPPTTTSRGAIFTAVDGQTFTLTWMPSSGACSKAPLTPGLLGDFNGDGATDYFDNVPSSVCALSGMAPDLVSTITNGFGGSTTIAYLPSPAWPTTHSDPMCTPSSSEPSCPNNPPVRQLVATVTANDGQQGSAVSTTPSNSTGHSATTAHDYADGYYDRKERRHLGFHYEKRTLPCDNGETACPYEEWWFHQDYGSASKPDKIYRSTGAGVLLTAVFHTYQTNGATIPYQSLDTGLWEYTYDGTGGQACPGANCKRTYTGYVYDIFDPVAMSWLTGFGNRIQTQEWGDYDLTGDERTTYVRYATANTSAYIVGLPAVVDTYTGIGPWGQLLAESITLYDNATSWQATPSVGNSTALERCQDTSLQQGDWTYTVKTFGYDRYGNVQTIWDENNNITKFGVDQTYHQYIESVTNPLNQTWSAPLSQWDLQCGVAGAITDPNQQPSVTTFDALCRPSLLTRPLGRYAKFSYCGLTSQTNQCGSVSGSGAQYTEVDTPSADGNGDQWARLYADGRARTWRLARKGPAASGSISTDAVFGARGRLAQQTAPYYPADQLQWTAYLYDALNRPVAVTHADGTSVVTSYSLWSTTVTDELGHLTTDTHDSYGNRVLRQVKHQDAQGAVTYVTTGSSYDLLGDLKGVTDDAGNVWTYNFDSLRRTTSSIDPDRGSSSFHYYPNGTLWWQVDAKNQKTTYGYDGISRPSWQTMLDGTPSAFTSTWTYDEARSGFFNIGHLTTVTDAAGTQVFNYDAAGRPTQMVRTINGAPSPFTFGYGYDTGDRLLWIAYPDGDMLGSAAAPLTYDGAGRPYSIPGVVASVSYDAWDHLTSLSNQNGTTSTRSYSAARGWLTSLTTQSSVSHLQDSTFVRDAKGRILEQTSNGCLEGWSFSYDDLNRLVSALNQSDYTRNEYYSYDSTGNITYSSRVGFYSYPPSGPHSVQAHAVQTAGPNAYQYDANGNMTSRAGQTLSYDGLDRLVSANGVGFVYAALGSRVIKSGASVTYYVGDDIEIVNGVVTKYIRLGKGRVAKRVGATTYWIHEDQIGSTNVLTDASGAEVQRQKFSPYGDTLQSSGSVSESTNFTGERRDETGLIYLHSRYYDPVLARFLSADPSHPRLPGVGVNRYAYALGNPIGVTDHSGLDGTDDDSAPYCSPSDFPSSSSDSTPSPPPGPDDTPDPMPNYTPAPAPSPDYTPSPTDNTSDTSPAGFDLSWLPQSSGAYIGVGLEVGISEDISAAYSRSWAAGAFADGQYAAFTTMGYFSPAGSYPDPNPSDPNAAYGLSLGGGGGVWISNATSPGLVYGGFDVRNVNVGPAYASLAVDSRSGIYQLSAGVTRAPFDFFSYSHYQTYTTPVGEWP